MHIGYFGAAHLPTGYGEATRANVKALRRVGVEVSGFLNSPLHAGMAHEYVLDDSEINEAFDHKCHPKSEKDAWILHITPDVFQRFDNKPHYLASVWECVGLPPNWASYVNLSDGLITFSQFSADRFKEAGVTVPIKVCPHPMDLERFNPQVDGTKLREQFEGVETLFLANGQFMFRKGWDDLLTAYLTEFAPNEKVGLVIISFRWGHNWHERKAVERYLSAIKAGLNFDAFPPMWFVGDKLEQAMLPEWYAACDVLVSASRGEGFGLTAAEAAACGKPCVLPKWGGWTEFLNEDAVWWVPVQQEPVHGSGPRWIHYNGHQFWGRPSLMGLRKAMRMAHEDREGRIRKGRAAFEQVSENLAFPRTGEIMKNALTELLDTKRVLV